MASINIFTADNIQDISTKDVFKKAVILTSQNKVSVDEIRKALPLEMQILCKETELETIQYSINLSGVAIVEGLI